ncbi:hypothetical protein Sinac_2687 [Singulisphaera acidiphila DSM 18658]|uniref:Uncharacterized protein n=1 Tax=Singulisphaera acidiphila (strain ATCC BAA-1392 / DSM 18658 / VKM B-2454 / MOB10) TaxID=886293 RepID=L0DDP6_SINAD|nr:hypothetical protein Sinac_2687 [Singulisphaera acidiphila DSM 18658]
MVDLLIRCKRSLKNRGDRSNQRIQTKWDEPAVVPLVDHLGRISLLVNGTFSRNEFPRPTLRQGPRPDESAARAIHLVVDPVAQVWEALSVMISPSVEEF